MSVKAKVGDKVCIVWDDANATHDEHKVEEWPELSTVSTYGILVKKTDKAAWVAAEIIVKSGGERDGYRCTTAIPLGMIVKVTVLKG